MKKGKRIVIGVLFLFASLLCQAQNNKNLASTPPMGWNSWNWFGKNAIDEELIKEVIDAMAEHNLDKYGYEYVVVDGGWRDTKLGPNGELLVNEKFPGGMKALADYAHSRGFKFGLHTVPGSHDCGLDKVGAWDYEEIHVKQLVAWGVDFIKLDKCRFSLDENPDYPRSDKKWFAGWGENNENLKTAYERWNKLLRESGKDIILSASAYRYFDWYPELTHMGRTTGDIRSRQSGRAVFDGATKPHNSMMHIADKNNKFYKHAGPGYWNDPDMMVIGDQGLTYEEQKVHFALWCIMSSPLMLGNDPRNMSADEIAIITNKDAIAINQDPTEQGKRIKKEGPLEIWAKKLDDDRYGVLFLNRDDKESGKVTLAWKDLDLEGERLLQEVYEGKDIGSFDDAFSKNLEPHTGFFFIVK